MKVQVFVRLKSGVLDVQGKAVLQGLHSTGEKQVGDIRVGKLLELEIESTSKEEAKAKVEQLCEKVLVNTIIEQYEIKFPTP